MIKKKKTKNAAPKCVSHTNAARLQKHVSFTHCYCATRTHWRKAPIRILYAHSTVSAMAARSTTLVLEGADDVTELTCLTATLKRTDQIRLFIVSPRTGPTFGEPRFPRIAPRVHEFVFVFVGRGLKIERFLFMYIQYVSKFETDFWIVRISNLIVRSRR